VSRGDVEATGDSTIYATSLLLQPHSPRIRIDDQNLFLHLVGPPAVANATTEEKHVGSYCRRRA
jgi:hypothetical protein